MKNKPIILLLLTSALMCLFCNWAPAAEPFTNASESLNLEAARLVRRNLREVKNISRFITNNYPVSDYHYVTVGRSPTAIEVFMRLNGTPVTNFPLTGARSLMLPRADVFFKRHFERQIPPVEDKKLLFIDYSFNGGSFVGLEKQLQKMSGTGALKNHYEFLILTSRNRAKNGLSEVLSREISTVYRVYILSRFGHLADDFLDHSFGVFSQYLPYYVIQENGAKPVKNPRHQLFVGEMRRRLNIPSPLCNAIL